MSEVGSGARSKAILSLIGTLLVASTLVAVVAPARPAAGATVTFGTIQGQMANHLGLNDGTGGSNCIRYSPTSAPATSPSNFVASPSEALTAHGRSGGGNNCPAALSTTTQSAVGFRPSTATAVEDGVSFLVGRMVHYNNPVQASDEYFTGTMNVRLSSFSTTIAFPWTLDETPNDGPSPNDEIAFSSQISDVNLVQGGLTFRLVVNGFIQTATGTTCPASPAGTPQNRFSTVEGTQTHACLYGTIVQARTLTIVKQVNGTSPPARTFGFTSSSTLAGSAWSNGSFNLSAGGTFQRDLTSGNTVTVTETDPNDDRWTLTGLTCTEIGANGQPQQVPRATLNLAARQVVLTNVPPPANVNQPGITCTFTNTYTPRATLTLVKQVQSGTATPNLWTLTATGSAAPPPAGAVISGPSGSTPVTSQRVPAGTYTLSEAGTGAAATGYVQVGDWSCQRAGGGAVAVAGGTVTLTDVAATSATANVTCTATNRLATGSLRISKLVDAPAGAYTGGTTKTFSGTYSCGTGFTGPFTTLTTGSPVVVANVPAGRTCTVTENAPTGGLANASYAWIGPTFSEQPVTISDQGTAQVTITNRVEQSFGTFALTKAIVGPNDTVGYTGGTTRVFPVAYTCTLTGGPTTSGTLNLTTAQAVSPAAPIPTGSVCTFTETLTTQPGDFADPSYVWTGSAVSPASVTIANSITATATITNTFTRQLGSLVITKAVAGDGYLGGATPNFTVLYSCSTGFEGSVTIANGASATVGGLPAGMTCAVQEVPPAPGLLSPAFTWGTPTWSPSAVATIVANASTTVTVTNPTQPIFGQVSITKAVTGETQGIGASATFRVSAVCTNGATFPFDLAAGASGTTPDIPVGTACTITEDTPAAGGLIDGSFAWGPTPAPQTVTITSSGQVAAVTMTNTVVRVTGQLTIAKAAITPGNVVDAGRQYAVTYSCVYGNDPAVAGTVNVTAGGPAAPVGPLFIGSRCTIREDPATLDAPPSAIDASWAWLPPVVTPSDSVVIESSTAPLAATVTNSIRQITSGFTVTKRVIGEGSAGYVPGTTFAFTYTCTNGVTGTFSIADGASFSTPTPVPAFTTCTVTETSPPPVSAAYGWDPVEFTVSVAATTTGSSVTFTIPTDPAGAQVNATNPITPRLGAVRVAKMVTGLTAGLSPAAPPFTFTLDCGPSRVYQLDVPAGGSAVQADIPVGSVCTAAETAPTGGLVDASFAWGEPTIVPATVTVTGPTPVDVQAQNPIVQVTAPVQLVKTYTGPQGVIDPARTYPVTWSCTYGGAQVAGGSVDIVADPTGVTVADAVPLTSVCSATEGGLGTPSPDPAFRWEAPVITGTTLTIPGPNTVTVANTLTRDSGTVLVRKQVTGATEGYVNLGTGAQDFTLHGSCNVPADLSIPRRFADGTIADGGEVPITASIGWTCSGYEDTPSQALLRDASFAWAPAILTPAGEFILTRAQPVQVFLAQNPIVRVSSSLSIEKTVLDPNGVVDPAAQYSGTYTCQYGTDAPVTGLWTVGAGETFTVPGILLTSVCTVTETTPDPAALRDSSWTWAAPVISAPATVVAGATARVTVTNAPQRLWGGLQVIKAVVDTVPSGVLPGATFGGVWSCTQGTGANETTYSDRFTVAASATTVLFGAADQRVPAGASCTVIEDTLATQSLVDGSFAWAEPTYVPDGATVTLVAGQDATVGITNTVQRVYSDITVNKVVIGPAAGLVPTDRPFTGTITCQYGSDVPITTTWLSTLATPALRAGVLVGSVCSAEEDPPGQGGQPVTGDSSYIWLLPIVSAPVAITPPDVPTPPIVVTNVTDRLFGTFTVTKAVTGATEGIVDPTAPYVMNWVCVDASGNQYEGQLEVSLGVTRSVGQAEQIPTGSACTLDEPLADMPALIDDAWQWLDPVFTVDGFPAVGNGRQLAFTIPTPQEDMPQPNVAVGVLNTVSRTPGAFTLAKTSDPPSGTVVQPGSVVSYTVTLTSTGTVPVHDVVVTDDLSGVLANAALVDGSVVTPTGTTAALDTTTSQLVWTVGDVPAATTLTLTYQVRVNPGAGGVTIRNSVSGTGDVAPEACSPAAPCVVDHSTAATPYVSKTLLAGPTRDSATGEWTVRYRLLVINPAVGEAAYDLSDTLGFAPGIDVRSAAITASPPGAVLASPAWNGGSNATIATGVALPGGATHMYDVNVVVFVPLNTPAGVLGCTTNPGSAGSGLFNSASVASLGAVSTASACAPVPLLLQVAKVWVIDGTEYPDGTQPSGYSAAPTLDGGDREWSTLYDDYQPGVTVAIDERVTVPDGCMNTSTGVGPRRLDRAFTAVTVINTVDCFSLPDTGWRGRWIVGIAMMLILAGAVVLVVSRRRRVRSAS